MPRPKRSKVAPSAPIALPHLAKSAVASAAQKQKIIFSPASSGRVTTTSDDSDGLVVSKKTEARAQGPKGHEYTMSGALPPEDIGPTRVKPPSNQTRAALLKIAREADYAKKRAEAKRDAAPAESVVEPEQIPSSIPSEPVLALKPSKNGINVSPTIKNVEVGLGSKTSEMSRPQPSMLGATFKKRARQPSLLQMLQTQNDPSENLDDDGLDDFRPDDESTPMIKSMLQSNAQHTSSSPRHSSGSRKRKLAAPEIQIPASQSESPDPPSSPPSAPPQEQGDLYEVPAEEAERPEPTLPPSRFSLKPQQQQIDGDTLAPPRSSSPLEIPHARNKIRRKSTTKAASTLRPQQKTRRKSIPSAQSPHFSSTSTNQSPVKPIPPPPKPLATATLQNLLPRRRAARPKTPRSEYDVPGSSSDVELDGTALGEDEDELSFHAAAKMRRKKKRPLQVAQKRGAAAAAAGGGKGKTKEDAASNASGKRVSKTYTKKTVVLSDHDDEDEDVNAEEGTDNDAALGGGDEGRRSRKGKDAPAPAPLDGRAMDEMKRLARKFKEVDEYELEFEEMTGNSSSQMVDAR